MARRPFFSGNYGSALGSTANAANLIARAGQQQGQMYANMGQQIGGMIQQYGLNKEKRQKEEDTAMGNLANFSPQDLLTLEQTNPKLRQAIKRATSDQASPRDFQLINSATAPFVANKARELDTRFKTAQIQGIEFKNKLDKADEENRLLRSTLETESMQTLNKYKELQLEVLGIERDIKSNERDVDRDKKYAELEQKKLALENLRQDIQSKKNTNSVFSETLDRERTKFSLGIAEATSRLALNARKIDELDANSTIDTNIKQEQLAKLKAERQTIEQDLTKKQQLMESFRTENQTTDDFDLIDDINIADSAQGDAKGLALRGLETVGSFLGQDLTPETTAQAQNIEALNMYLRPALTKQISSRPSNYTQQIVNQNLLSRSDGDPQQAQKIKKLIPMLQNRLEESITTIQNSKNISSEFVTEASKQARLLPKLINKLKKAVEPNTKEISEEELLNRY